MKLAFNILMCLMTVTIIINILMGKRTGEGVLKIFLTRFIILAVITFALWGLFAYRVADVEKQAAMQTQHEQELKRVKRAQEAAQEEARNRAHEEEEKKAQEARAKEASAKGNFTLNSNAYQNRENESAANRNEWIRRQVVENCFRECQQYFDGINETLHGHANMELLYDCQERCRNNGG